MDKTRADFNSIEEFREYRREAIRDAVALETTLPDRVAALEKRLAAKEPDISERLVVECGRRIFERYPLVDQLLILGKGIRVGASAEDLLAVDRLVEALDEFANALQRRLDEVQLLDDAARDAYDVTEGWPEGD